MLPLVHYRPQIVKIFIRNLKENNSNNLKSKVFGATCQEVDVLFEGSLPKATIGSYIVFYVVGAYNQNMSSDFIFEKPKSFEY